MSVVRADHPRSGRAHEPAFPHRLCRPCVRHAPQAGARRAAPSQMHGCRPVAAAVPGQRQDLPRWIEGARQRVQGLQEPRAAYARRLLGRGAGQGAQLVPAPGRGADPAGLADGGLLRGRAQPLLHGPAASVSHPPVRGGEQHPPGGGMEHLQGLRRAVRARQRRVRQDRRRDRARGQLAGAAGLPGRREVERLLREADRPLRHPARHVRPAGRPRPGGQAHRLAADPVRQLSFGAVLDRAIEESNMHPPETPLLPATLLATIRCRSRCSPNAWPMSRSAGRSSACTTS